MSAALRIALSPRAELEVHVHLRATSCVSAARSTNRQLRAIYEARGELIHWHRRHTQATGGGPNTGALWLQFPALRCGAAINSRNKANKWKLWFAANPLFSLDVWQGGLRLLFREQRKHTSRT
jgi:hypothetical protein